MQQKPVRCVTFFLIFIAICHCIGEKNKQTEVHMTTLKFHVNFCTAVSKKRATILYKT